MKQRQNAYNQNLSNIKKLLESDIKALFLDLGCDDGKTTIEMAKKMGTENIAGFDLIESRLKIAKDRGIKVIKGDLNKKLPFKNSSFNVILSNQVIEHLSDTDLFISEIYRILRPGGYIIISTENLASWHNIFALILGFMPFSLTNISSKTAALGNPLDTHANEDFCWNSDTWQHQRIFTTTGLRHLLTLHGFKVEEILTAGYYPLPDLFARFDKYHSAFITFKARK